MIRSAVLGPLIRALETAEVPLGPLLGAFGMSRKMLSNPYEVLPLGRYVQLFEHAAELLDEPSLGLRLGSSLEMTEHGPAGLVFLSSPTLEVAIAKFSRALESWTHPVSCEVVEIQDWPVWVYQILDTQIWPRRQDTEYSVSAMCNMIRLVKGSNWNPTEVIFEHPAPADPKPYFRVFRSPVRFNQPTNGLVLMARDLDTPLQTADARMLRLMERHASDLIVHDAPARDLVEQVRELVSRRIMREKLHVEDIARDLGLSHRSLQRHLAQSGTSVRQIVREARQQRIDALQHQGSMSKGAVARAVGYADATVLWRAVQGWKKD